MFEIKKQGNNGRKPSRCYRGNRNLPLATLGNLKLACVELGISDDKHTLRRASRAFDLYNSGKVEHLSRKAFALSGESHRVDHTFAVKSQYRERLPYQVHISKSNVSYCTCPDWMNYSGDKVLPDVHFHCKHSIAARIWLHHNGNGSKIVNECGTETAKALQTKLNGSNGKGGESHSSTQLDTNDPFQESELLDIEQIQGKRNGDLVHHLKNGKYIISYNGIMKLAEQHNVTFTKHTVKSDAKRNGTVVAHARLGNNTRASGKPMNGSFITAVELAKRNAARQLLPLVEIKALEKKAQLEGDFDWQKAKAKCLEIVPDFTFDILLNDLVKDGKLEQKHTSDYSRKEWLVIFDACKRDAETNGNDDNNGDGDNTPSRYFYKKECGLFNIYDELRKDTKHFCIKHGVETETEVEKQVDELNASEVRRLKFDECRAVAKDFVRFSWLKDDMLRGRLRRCSGDSTALKEGILSGDWTDDDFTKLKEACEIDASLFGKELGHWTIDIQPNTNAPFVHQRRYWFWLVPLSKQCFWCGKQRGAIATKVAKPSAPRKESILPDTVIKWKRYEIKASLCLECKEAKHPNGEELTQRFDELYHADPSERKAARKAFRRKASASHRADVPDTAEEFVERCKEADVVSACRDGLSSRRTRDDTTDNANDKPLENGDGGAGGLGTDGTAVRKLQMDKKLRTWLVEADGTKTEISCREICEQFNGNIVMQLRAGIDSGGDISTVELDN